MRDKISHKLVCLFWMYFQLVCSQSEVNLRNVDYSEADSVALNFPKDEYKSYVDIAVALTENFDTDHQKYRVIFRWIADNIVYSYSNRSSDPGKVLKTKKAVCIGYSTLLKEMCNAVGIECEVIVGYAKNSIDQLGTNMTTSYHAWNAVKLKGKWYLSDVTWASGSYDEKKRKFMKYYNDFYYLTPPEFFIKTHYPKYKCWQLLDKPVRKSKFMKECVYYKSFFYSGIKKIYPWKGVIRIKLKNDLNIKFLCDSKVENVMMIARKSRTIFVYNLYINPKETTQTYSIKQKFQEAGVYDLELFVNYYLVCGYKLIVKK